MNPNDPIAALREALKFSPDNLPLRRHLAETLLATGRPDEAEKEFKSAIGDWPEDRQLKVGLATAFHRQGKHSAAMVVVEDLLRLPDPPPGALLLHSRLLLGAGDVDRAVRQYKRAIEADPALHDIELSSRLGVAGPSEADDEHTREVVDGKVRASNAQGAGEFQAELEKPAVRFADVGGMDALKDEIRMKIIHPLAHADLYKAYGKTIGGGILMYGPPGCGKTHLARATAGEINANFVSVGINDVLDMWIGNSEKNLHAVFDQARRNKPCVLFFDEVDALAASRADMRLSGGRHLINQFLSELDGIESSNEGVLILAATNAPWHLDSAFRRPGRFDRILFVPPPDAPARAAILRVMLKGKPVGEIDHDHVAKKADNFSGADIKAIIDQAIEAKLREAMKDGIARPLTTKDLTAAATGIRPSTKEWFATARNYALYANQGGAYDDVLKFLKL
jgi:SpoVK/Ycf46/Vps4 family AAA+-type ATPase